MTPKKVYQAKIEKAKHDLDELLKAYEDGRIFYPHDRIIQLENRIRNLTELAKKFR